jgi:hypothetical protein
MKQREELVVESYFEFLDSGEIKICLTQFRTKNLI